MSKITKALKKIRVERQKNDDSKISSSQKFARMESSHIDHLDTIKDTVVTPSVASSNIGIRTTRIVRLDKNAMRDAGLISPISEKKLFEDEYRVIKRPILSNASNSNAIGVEKGYVVLVSSALSGDGKTFTCINLAQSLARERDTSVLLVDADVPKRHITSLFDTEEEPGLLDYLDGSVASIGDIELRTSEEGLSLLPAGKSRADATELLSSGRMLKLFDTIHRQDPHKIILIDSSPLLQTTESRAMASVAGQIVLVVRAGVTPKGAVVDAVATLDREKSINLILNQVRYNRNAGQYGGYFGGYGSAYGKNDESDQ